MRGAFKGGIQLADERLRFEGAFAARPPDRLRLEVGGPLGGPRAVLMVRGSSLRLLLPATREYLEEDASPGTYEALLGVRLSTTMLLDLLELAAREDCSEADCALLLPASGDGADLSLERRDRRLVARPLGGHSSFLWLELRLQDAGRVEESSLAEELFWAEAPAGWTRLAGRAAGDSPLLFSR